jgi:integrase
MKRDVVHVAGQLGHSNPSTTLRIYAHMFDKARHAEDTRAAMDDYFGKLLPSSS